MPSPLQVSAAHVKHQCIRTIKQPALQAANIRHRAPALLARRPECLHLDAEAAAHCTQPKAAKPACMQPAQARLHAASSVL